MILRLLSVLVFSLVAGLANAQECAVGPAPACGGSCQADSVCTIGQSGTPCECVPGAPLTVTKMGIKLNFSKADADSITLSGKIPVPDGFSAAGREVVVDVGGVVAPFLLDEKGKSKREGAQMKLTVKASKGIVLAQDAKLAIKLSKGNFSSSLADEGLVDATLDDAPVQVRAEVTVDAARKYPIDRTLLYRAKAGKTGSAK